LQSLHKKSYCGDNKLQEVTINVSIGRVNNVNNVYKRAIQLFYYDTILCLDKERELLI